ncbi:sugar ABC transporter substrate-binding protein [Clostridia bacterium]|nr:sugar ABC transporter substrate-binding protein [Clostridia bacterium]
MSMTQLSAADFSEVLSSKEPVPGGGGASAYVGALGVALGAMVGSLTTGKAKYADVQEDIEDLLAQSQALRLRLLGLIDGDAEAFAPLAKAYGLPSGTDEEKQAKAETLEAALKTACDVPLAIMRASCEAICLNAEFAKKGSRLAISDAGAGVTLSKAALIAASLNVFINTKLMKDRGYAKKLNEEAEAMIAKYSAVADEVYQSVRAEL